MNRRRFLQVAAGSAAFFGLARRGYPFSQSPRSLPLFDATLPGLGPGGANNQGNYLTVLSPNTTKFPGKDYYEIVAKEFTQQLHSSMAPTKFWGYADATTLDQKYLGGVIVAKRRRPVKLKITNLLPSQHILPYDPTAIDTLMGAEVGQRTDRIAVHLHGGLVHWQHDGGPFSWFSNALNPGGSVHGSSFLNGAGPGAAIYDYPNDQSARMVWYHDHAYGITRTNAYAGLASAYLITDDAETTLVNLGIIPSAMLPLVIQDKSFWDGGITDPGYDSVVPAGASSGSLWYPHTYEGPELADMTIPAACGSGTGRWDLDPLGSGAPPVSLIPEAFADVILVNGAPWPKVEVKRQRYRLRLLNGSQARFFNLQWYLADGSRDGITLKDSGEIDGNGNHHMVPANKPGPKVIQIGTEGGFLPAPVVLNDPPLPIGFYQNPSRPNDPKNGNANRYNLLLAPAERADLIIDFSDVPDGASIVLYNDATAPFPGGDIRYDYYGGGPDLTCIGGAATPSPGYGPDTRVIMRFDVKGTHTRELTFDQTLAALKAALPVTFLATQGPLPSALGVRAKQKTLNEDFDSYGRLRQTLGVAPGGTELLGPITEFASKGEVQMWKIYNLTGDTHPMHFHLVNVLVLKREAWKYTVDHGEPVPVLPLAPIPGSERPPDPNERGFKETVRMNPGEVVTVLMKFDLPPGAIIPSPRLKAQGIKGAAEYVWHCHILEHEEHDMMHALVVV